MLYYEMVASERNSSTVPYCPRCREEFQDWVKVCPDCGVALVDKLPVEKPPVPPKREKHAEPLVRIATAPNEPVAYMWAGILEDHGIRCLVKGAELRPAAYVFAYNPQCEIHVLASEAERAGQILAALLKDNEASHPEER